MSDDVMDLLPGGETAPNLPVPIKSSIASTDVSLDEGYAELMDFQQEAGLQAREKTLGDIRKPWMLAHEFVIIRTIEQLRSLVDEALKVGKCALDLETEGLDNRIVFNTAGQAETVHKIVGYCLSTEGHTGYYVPVRHLGEAADWNLDALAVEGEIRRLCLAAQPVLTEESLKEDPLSGRKFIQAPQVVIYFWNAKFDQEFLFPITGIGFWHPESFEDGLLAYFCQYTGDKMLSLKKKAPQILSVRVTPDMVQNKTDETDRQWGMGLFKGGEKFINAPYEMIEITELFSGGKKSDVKWAELHPEEGRHYACSDAICTFLLCDGPVQAIIKDKKFAQTYRLEKQVSQSVRKVERNRVLLDLAVVNRLIGEADVEAKSYEEKILALAAQKGFHDFDIRSPKQLGEFLFTERGLDLKPKPERNEASGQYKTDADTLEALAEMPGAPDILIQVVKFRQIDKVKGTYLLSMAHNCPGPEKRIPLGEARVQYKQTGAATGRFSAPGGEASHGFAGFPSHGIPSTYDDKKPKVATSLRQCFIPRVGYKMVKIDYAAEELRIVTNLSGEPAWTKEFLEGTGDLHSITARAFFGKQEISKQERQAGKISNFTLVYGGGGQAIARATGCTLQEGARRKQAFDKAVPTFSKWVKGQHATAKNNLGVWSAFGRWIAIPDACSPDRAVQAACERYSSNFPIQASGADIMKISMVLLHREFAKRRWINDDGRQDIVRMLLSVHDELVFEVRDDMLMSVIPVIKHYMEEPGRMVKWLIPLVVEILVDKSWDAKYNWEHLWEGEKGIPQDKKLKDWQFRMGDVVYGVPNFLRDSCVPPWVAEYGWSGGGPGSGGPSGNGPDGEEGSKEEQRVSAPQVTLSQPPAQRVQALPEEDLLVWKIEQSRMTRGSARIVAAAIVLTHSPTGQLLKVTTGDDLMLVDPRLGIRVDPNDFKYEMKTRNL